MIKKTLLLEKVNKLLKSFRYASIYRRLRLPLKDFQDFKRLPLTDKDILRNVRPNPKAAPFRITATSGTTESRLLILQPKACYERHVARVSETYAACGIRPGDTCLNLCAYELNGGGSIMEEAFRRLGVTVIPFGIIRTRPQMLEAIAIIKRFKPSVINSYTNQLYGVLEQLKNGHSVNKCIVNGEPLFAGYKRNIEKYFGVRIYNNYGSMEFSGFAMTAGRPKESMKLFDEGLFIEILKDDGETAEQGKGRIIITDLENLCVPLIRYCLGDRVELKYEKGEGRLTVFGRTNDSILIDGEIFSKREILESLQEILARPDFFLVIGKNPRSYKDTLVLHLRPSHAAKQKEIFKRWNVARKAGDLLRIRLSSVAVPKNSTGKFQHIIDARPHD
ncbi:MAG: hypothetical protein WC732_04710 [Candidatus Omnitrophota bacterium]